LRGMVFKFLAPKTYKLRVWNIDRPREHSKAEGSASAYGNGYHWCYVAVVEVTNFDACWPADQLKAKGIVTSIREVVNPERWGTRIFIGRTVGRFLAIRNGFILPFVCVLICKIAGKAYGSNW
jgi:hypothetical protein